ncbi:MAG: PHP domain-containing protein [Acidobacteria bacterium]|nr:PHP domain-containing protein [Acidobacteriota bacterium]
MKTYQADLHIHSKLSPCGSWDMTPHRVVERAKTAGLDLIAICDHNAAGNVGAFMEAAEGTGLVVIAGMEITTSEEIHVVGLFPDRESARDVANSVQSTLPITDARYASRFGEQVLMDPAGNILGYEKHALAMATTFTLEETVSLIQDRNGLAIPAHIERPSFSVYSQLGDLPRWMPFDAVEVSPVAQRPIGLREKFARYGFPMVGSSDSHFLHEIGRARTLMQANGASFRELEAALRKEEGRGVDYA